MSLFSMQNLRSLTDSSLLNSVLGLFLMVISTKERTLSVRPFLRTVLSLGLLSYFWKLKMSQMNLRDFYRYSYSVRWEMANSQSQCLSYFSWMKPVLLFKKRLNSEILLADCELLSDIMLLQYFYLQWETKGMEKWREGGGGQVLIIYNCLIIKMSDNISFSSNRSSIQKFKIVLVGDQNVGKSSIIARYIRNEFDPTKNPTIGIDFISKNIATSGKIIRLQLWDTAGQQRFKSLIPSYLKDAHMALVVFDLANLPSAESIPKWVDFIREAGKKDIKVYIIGNKCDLENEILNETRKMAEDLAEKQAEYYREVSAKTSANIEDLFNKIIDDLLASMNKKKEPVAQSLNEPEKPLPQNEAGKGKEEKGIKLGSMDSKTWQNQVGGCCQK